MQTNVGDDDKKAEDMGKQTNKPLSCDFFPGFMKLTLYR